jgi:hypothetical protein
MDAYMARTELLKEELSEQLLDATSKKDLADRRYEGSSHRALSLSLLDITVTYLSSQIITPQNSKQNTKNPVFSKYSTPPSFTTLFLTNAHACHLLRSLAASKTELKPIPTWSPPSAP